MDLNKMMKQAAKMQSEMAKAQEQLASQEVEGTSGGGAVKVTMTGAGEFIAVKIDPEAIDLEDPSLLEDLVLAALNDATRAQQELAESSLGSITGGLDLKGLPGFK